jgi:RNA polymerase sigma-70 factor, ECF subfamily
MKGGGKMALIFLRDEDLVSGLKRSDPVAFVSLIKRYGDRILKVCYLMLKDYASAEDAAQETFIQVYRSINSFKGQSSLYTWMYKIVINKCRNILKKKDIYSSLDETEIFESGNDIEYEVLSDISMENVGRGVLSLAYIYREVITLFYFEDLAIKDICSILNESEGTIKSKLHRGRKILKDILLKEGMEYER